MISNTNYNHLTWDTLDAPIQIDYMQQWPELPIRIYYKVWRQLSNGQLLMQYPLPHDQSGVLLCPKHILWWFLWFVDLQLPPPTTVSYSVPSVFPLFRVRFLISIFCFCLCILVSAFISIVEISYLLLHLNVLWVPYWVPKLCHASLSRCYLTWLSVLTSYASS